MIKPRLSLLKQMPVLIVALFLSACASTGAHDERDPWEGFNRGVYSFNQTMDNIVFEPVANVYDLLTPDVLDNGISNVFDNISQLAVIANDLLQFKFGQAVNDSVRFFLNSTLGLLGFFDISSDAGLYSSDEDFGQTLAHWGVGPGPYVVVPFFGPTTVRDASGFAIDRGVLSPLFYIEDDLTRAGLLSLNYIDVKSDLLSTTDLVGGASVDEYEFVKNAYFQKRASQIGGEVLEDFPEE